ncbi:MAG: hypothetical protein HY738_01360, partial [Bacteroidia bacterium]|nr:hypothetical protein [Bacteroidia bacterium]
MNNKIFLYILLICFIIIQGCVIRQEIHFNKNFSGTYKFTFDYSKLSAFSKKNDSLKSSEQDISSTFKERVKELEKISGLSEITYLAEKQEGKVYLSYKFINTEVLNESLKHSSSLDMKTGAEGAPSFNLKGKKLSYYRPEFNLNADTLKGVLENMFRYE